MTVCPILLRSRITSPAKELTDPIPPSQKCRRSFGGPETEINRPEKNCTANQVRSENCAWYETELNELQHFRNYF